MKRLAAVLCMLVIAVGAHATARAATVSVWGFPLGVSASALRAAAGAPLSTQKLRAPAFPLTLGGAAPQGETWTYQRNGVTFHVTVLDGIACGIVISSGSPLLGQTADHMPADPFGLHVGDPAGDLLIKSGAVPSIDPNSQVQVLNATISVTRNHVHYTFQIFEGRITNETAYYVL